MLLYLHAYEFGTSFWTILAQQYVPELYRSTGLGLKLVLKIGVGLGLSLGLSLGLRLGIGSGLCLG